MASGYAAHVFMERPNHSKELHETLMTDLQTKAVQDRILRIIIGSRDIDPASIKPETTLAQLNVESLDAVSIVFDIEAEFKVNIPDSEVYKLNTVGDVFACVERLLQDRKEPLSP